MQLSDSGVYTCVARSQAGLAELSYDVQVQGTIPTVDNMKTERAGSDVVTLCVYGLQCPPV